MPSVPPPPPSGRGGDPVRLGELLGLALPRREQGRVLDLEFLKTLWDRAVPEGIARNAVPVRVERRILTIVTDDPRIRAEAHRRRTEIARNLVRAAGLPDASLRIRVEFGSLSLARDEAAGGPAA